MGSYSLPPGGQVDSKFTALTNTTKTDCFTVGDDGEKWADLLGVSVTASTGTAGTATVAIFKAIDNVEMVVIFEGAVRANIPLELIGSPCTHLEPGDIVRVTGAANQVVCVSYAYGTRAPDARRSGD